MTKDRAQRDVPSLDERVALSGRHPLEGVSVAGSEQQGHEVPSPRSDLTTLPIRRAPSRRRGNPRPRRDVRDLVWAGSWSLLRHRTS